MPCRCGTPGCSGGDECRENASKPTPPQSLAPDLFQTIPDWSTPTPGGGSGYASPGTGNSGSGFLSAVKSAVARGLAYTIIPLPFVMAGEVARFNYQALSAVGQLTYSENQERALTWPVYNYRGQITISIDAMGRDAISLGPIMGLGGRLEYPRDIDTLRHEHGHFLEYHELGFLTYYLGIGFMSVVNAQRGHSREFYLNQPWEINADILAGVMRDFHDADAIALGELYFMHLQSIGGITGDTGWFIFLTRDMWDFVNHNFTAIQECD